MNHARHGLGRDYLAGCAECQAAKREWRRTYMEGNDVQKERAKARARGYGAHRRPHNKAYQREYRRLLRRERMEELNAYKLAVGCADCGYSDPDHPYVLEFDHVRGEKLGEVSQMLTGNYEKQWDEIAKCEVVCANCHRIRTNARLRVSETVVIS